MEEHVEKLPDGPIQETETNPGWFRPGDARINREGRPRGSKAAPAEAIPPADRAPRADRLMLLRVPGQEVVFHLTHRKAPWFVNLPKDVEIVGCDVDSTHNIVFTIRSTAFPRIARGAPIPMFVPKFEGLMWRKTDNLGTTRF